MADVSEGKHHELRNIAWRICELLYRECGMVIVTILGTGIRRGEIINLRWLDVDFINHSISVFGKNRRKETIPITEKLELPAYQTFCNQTGEK
ncbi:tyrosine-type recombinase/integrase [Bacillus stercoris]|uniref:tyrosine-type recombinase/integrase n=2 Tax=Bacillus stercoris TaxID=2054641 RepID=UPI0010AA6189|nr:hypothetical protein BSB_18570 [Bacillus stercoris]